VWPRRTRALLEKGWTDTQSWLAGGVDVGDGEVLGFVLLLGLGDRLLGLGSGLELIVGVGFGLGLLLGLLPGFGALVLGLAVGDGLFLLGLVLGDGLWLWFTPGAGELLPETSDAETASAVALPGRALRAEVTFVAAAGCVVHDRFAAEVACVPANMALTRPNERTAVPAHAPKVAGPARQILTVSTSPWSMPHQGLLSSPSLITLCSPPKCAFPASPVRHLGRPPGERSEGKKSVRVWRSEEAIRIRVRFSPGRRRRQS
jgi:hypothetical protein